MCVVWMDIEIITWNKETFPTDRPVLGKVKVLLGGKMSLWLTVLKGKHKPFCKFPSIKIGDGYVPAIEWPERTTMERTISDYVITKLIDRNEL